LSPLNDIVAHTAVHTVTLMRSVHHAILATQSAQSSICNKCKQPIGCHVERSPPSSRLRHSKRIKYLSASSRPCAALQQLVAAVLRLHHAVRNATAGRLHVQLRSLAPVHQREGKAVPHSTLSDLLFQVRWCWLPPGTVAHGAIERGADTKHRQTRCFGCGVVVIL